MNPQYMPYGNPQQPQGFSPNRPPGPGPQGFQNVPLGSQKPPGVQFPQPNHYGGTPPMMNVPPNMRPPPSQLPPSQLPPSHQRPPSAGAPSFNIQNGSDLAPPIRPIAGVPPHQTPPQLSGSPAPMQPPISSQNGTQTMSSNNPGSQIASNSSFSQMPPNKSPPSAFGGPNSVAQMPGQPKPSTPQMMGSPATTQNISLQEPNITASQGMPGHNLTPISRQNAPTMPGQGMPPIPGQGMPPAVGQSMSPSVGQSMSPVVGQGMPPMPGQGMPPMPGQGMPPMPGQPMPGVNLMSGPQPPMPGQSHPPMPGQNQPPLPGQHQASLPGQHQSPMPGQHQSPMPGQHQPPMPGQHQPPMPGQQQPPMPGHQQPSMPGQHQPPMPGQHQLPMAGANMAPMPGANVGSPMAQNAPPPLGQNMPPMPNQMRPNMSMSGSNMPPINQNMEMPSNVSMSGPGPNMSMSGPNMSMPPMPGQKMPPTGRQYPSVPGQQQMQNQFSQGRPPMPVPGQQMQNKFTQGRPPMPGQPPLPGGAFNQSAGVPGQNQYNQFGPNQLSNQMQGMSMAGSYPGGQNRSVNGDNGPHMPPPLNQPGYVNGQQGRQGYPPQAQLGGPGSQYSSQPAYQQQQQQQPRRLDPDQMPSPIQVIEDDQVNRSGVFCTNQKGLVPPLVSTNFVVQDQGFASPRFLRSTMYNVPITNDLLKQTGVPFGLSISPMARTGEGEYPPPIVDFGEIGPIRCIRCKAYMCPFMQFIDSGRRFQCLFCKASTDVPAEYFQHLDQTGQRMDRYERPELVLGTYECTATKDYCRNNQIPKPPAIIFVIDVSYNNVKSGLVHLLCSEMKEIIQNLPVDQGQEKSNMRVGFITYDNTVHFYNIKGNLAAPQMMVVGDTQEMFMPLLDGFLCTPEESESVIDALMEQIPTMFAETRQCETILLPAIVAGLEALKASECAGKLLVFHSTLPAAEAPGKLKNRDDRKLLGTDKERTVLTPQNQTYNQLGQDCVGSGCSVDLFLFNNAYIDVATIGQVSRLTGGEVYKYTYFQADTDGHRLVKDIITNISRPIAFDAIMRVRTSTGVRPTDFFGHMFMSNTTDMELASIDCDKAISVEIKHDDKLQEDEGIYIQIALLYTSVSGQRRLRVINQALKTCSQMADLYRSCDLETIINFFSKQAVFKLLDNNPKAVKDGIVQRAAQMLANYRKNCASPSSAGQLILPECMKLLPLYVNCLLKSDALSGGADMTLDDRSYVMNAVMTMDIPSTSCYFYPSLIPLHEVRMSGDEILNVPSPIRCTIDKMSDQGVYILENGIHMFLWIGLGVNQDFVQQVFGVPSAVQINIEAIKLPELNNPLSEAIRSIVHQIRSQRHRYMRLTLVRQKEKMESVFRHFLMEDRGVDGTPGYVDFLCHMHKEIRSILS